MSNGYELTTPGRRTAVEYVEDELRARIIGGDLEGGAHITQTDTAQMLQVSTTPVREAFRKLESEGLVTLDKHRGAVVRRPELDDAVEIFLLRGLLEPTAARLVAERITDDEMKALRSLHEAMVAEETMSRWFHLNLGFHRAFIKATHSPRLTATLVGLLNSTGIYIVFALRGAPHPFHRGNDDHERMLVALERRDADALAAEVRVHLDHALSSIKRGLVDRGREHDAAANNGGPPTPEADRAVTGEPVVRSHVTGPQAE